MTQNMEALAKANEIRLARARLKEAIGSGDTSLAEALRADESYIQTMQLRQLMQAVPRMGPAIAQRALTAVRINQTAAVQNIPMVRREELIAWVSNRHSMVKVS